MAIAEVVEANRRALAHQSDPICQIKSRLSQILRVNHQCGLSFPVGAVSLRHWSTRPIKRDGPVGAAILPDPADCAKRPDLSYPPTRPSAI
jgi:hypothetical protein